MVGRNLRQLGETVARGKSAISIGVSYYTYLPFIKAGLPVKSISNDQRGLLRRHRVAAIVVLIKNHASSQCHPRYSSTGCCPRKARRALTKALGQPTRRFDVDTKWTREFGHPSAKEVLTPEKYDELENGSEEVVFKYRKPAMQLAEKLFRGV